MPNCDFSGKGKTQFTARLKSRFGGFYYDSPAFHFTYGGIHWMTATGNSEQVAKRKNTLIWATLGLIIIFSSYALVRFVIYEVIQAPTG